MPLYVFMAVFLVLAQALVVGAHFLIFKFIVKVFPHLSAGFRSSLFYGLLVLSFSFIPASILVRASENFWARLVYFLVGLWHGLILNLVLAVLGSYAVFWLVRAAGAKVNFRILGLIFILLALAASAYGVYNARAIRVKKVNVYLKNLPAGWEGKTAVQVSDTHLGNVLGRSYADKLVKAVKDLNPEIVFITGDYFDAIGDDADSLASSLSALKPAKGMYFVTGNHENYVGREKSISALQKAGVRVLQNEMIDLGGLELVGFSFQDFGGPNDLGAEISKLPGYDSRSPSILLYHSPGQAERVAKAGIDLMLCGHSHAGQLFPINFITKLIFRGYDYGLKQAGDMQVYTTSGAGVWGPTMRTSGRNEIVSIELRRK